MSNPSMYRSLAETDPQIAAAIDNETPVSTKAWS